MSDISKIHINPTGSDHNIKDATARAGIESSKTLKSSVVTVTDAYPMNAEDITVDITPVQLGSGTPSPDNIRPIEGWTGAELDRVGKNLFDKLSVIKGKGINSDGDIVDSNVSCVSDFIRVTPNTDYYLSTYNDKGTRRGSFYDANKNVIGVSSAKAGSRGFTTPSNCSYCRVSTTYAYDDTQLELGTQPTTYEPYQHAQATITFGETVYGGKWHVTEGGTDKTHANIANYNGETINEPWLSSMDEYVAGATPTTGAQVVYPLTTPTAISTPKQNVPMLQGINTVSADCGDTQLKYQPDNVVGELKGDIEDNIVYEDFRWKEEGSITYSAGTPGTYATSTYRDVAKEGYDVIGATFVENRQLGNCILTLNYIPSTKRVEVIIFRATSSSVTVDAEDVVYRVAYKKH